MRKRKCNVLRFAAVGIVLCLGIFAACENLTGGDDNANKTKVKFINLEQYDVTVYSDSFRQNEFAKVTSLGSTVVSAAPSASGIVFYPTFHLDLFDMPGISVPYNGPAIVTTIAEDSTTDVPIPKLETIDIGSAFIKVINNSNYSLALRRGGAEITPLGASSSIIVSNKSAVYEVASGPFSDYALMRNTVTPVAFPAGFTEFSRGMIYVLTYDGTGLTLQIKSVSGTSIIVPGSGLAAKLLWLQTYAESNTNYTVEVTTDESISPATLSYSNRSNIGITLKGTGAVRIIGVSSNGAMFTVSNDVTLVLDNNITLQGRSGNTNSLIRVNEGGRLVMNAGSAVTGNTCSLGGGVSVDNGTFSMSGGTVSGNTANSGGGVSVDNGTFSMSGGTVSGNTTANGGLGGGVSVDNGTFSMSGGTVSGNTANGGLGGGVSVWDGGTFNKTNGTIYGYSADDANSNVVKNSFGDIVSDSGHAVYAIIDEYSGKRKETTAGPSVNLSFNYNNGSPVFSGEWD